MVVGLAMEIKKDEYRVGLTPSGAAEYISNGHRVFVENTAGRGSGFEDNAYEAVGCTIIGREQLFAESEMIIKVKEPLPEEIPLLPAGIRDYEPRIALDGGSDGLEYYRKVVEQSLDYLRPGGCLMLEIGNGQSEDVCTIISQTVGFSLPETLKDLSNVERAVRTFSRVD